MTEAKDFVANGNKKRKSKHNSKSAAPEEDVVDSDGESDDENDAAEVDGEIVHGKCNNDEKMGSTSMSKSMAASTMGSKSTFLILLRTIRVV